MLNPIVIRRRDNKRPRILYIILLGMNCDKPKCSLNLGQTELLNTMIIGPNGKFQEISESKGKFQENIFGGGGGGGAEGRGAKTFEFFCFLGRVLNECAMSTRWINSPLNQYLTSFTVRVRFSYGYMFN